MSPVIFSCVLCGYTIYDRRTPSSPSWLQEFRRIYSTPSGIRLSGVGLYDDPDGGDWTAPLDSNRRWNDTHDFMRQSETIPVMAQSSEDDGRHGYLIHDACWSLLEEFRSPLTVSVDRLFEICVSLPFPLQYSGVCWGHDYGELVYHDEENHYPWEDRLMMHSNDSEIYMDAKTNPFSVPGILSLLQKHPQSPPSSGLTDQGTDCFTHLPLELLEQIAIYLPTKDVLGLRLASRAFLFIFHSQIFWGSRFRAEGDRGFIFEAWRNRKQIDWRTLYRNTAQSCDHGIQNRRRVWSLMKTLGDMLDLHLCPSPSLTPPRSDPSGSAWTRITADLRQEPLVGRSSVFQEGCTVRGRQRTPIPPGLSKLSVSIIAVGGLTYVTGIRLISIQDSNICLGYLAESKEVFYEVATIRGFVLAVGSRGIHGLQVINEDGIRSPWLGCPKSAPMTERLANFESIKGLEVDFDGFKLVSLGVLDMVSPRKERNGSLAHLLRKTALWYPAVPPSHLSLNDDSYTGEDPSSPGFRPLVWARFGGHGGIYLQYLTRISVSRLGSLCGVEFHYDIENVPANDRKIGRRRITQHSKVMDFTIDGPRGEIINLVEVSVRKDDSERALSIYKHGKLNSLKFTTTWNRSFHFLPSEASPEDVTLQELRFASGTTITGLYGTQHPEMGLVSLGVISEWLENYPPTLLNSPSSTSIHPGPQSTMQMKCLLHQHCRLWTWVVIYSRSVYQDPAESIYSQYQINLTRDGIVRFYSSYSRPSIVRFHFSYS